MRRISLVVAILAAAVTGWFNASAFAVANTNASCLGLGTSAAAPGPNSQTTGIPANQLAGLIASFAHERKATSAMLGVPPGSEVRQDAQNHAGSPEACFPE